MRTLDHGYEIQARANHLLERELGPRIGMKIGGTTVPMRRYIGAAEPVAGEVFAGGQYADGARLRLRDFVRPGVETEIAVRLAIPLIARPGRYEAAEMVDHIDEVMAAIEVVDDRYDDFATIGAPTIIADNAFNAGNLLGRPYRDWRKLDLGALTARTFRNGELVGEGRSDVLLGHPLKALAWLANRLARMGRGLGAGTFVSLGTITLVQWVDRPASYRIEVDELGGVGLEFV